MSLKRAILGLAALACFSVPASAGSFGFYGSYWDSDQADSSWGGAARMGFSFVKFLELEFHGTEYPRFKSEVGLQNIDVKALPVDGGLRFNFLPTAPFNPYVGAGASYYFLDSNQGSIDNQTGWYGEAGGDIRRQKARLFAGGMLGENGHHPHLRPLVTHAQFVRRGGDAGGTLGLKGK